MTMESLMARKSRPTPTLTDTQLVVLPAAAQRRDLTLVQPDAMPARAFSRAVNGLVKAGLVEAAQPAGNGRSTPDASEREPVYRVTPAGLAAIGIEPGTAPGQNDVPDGLMDSLPVLTTPADNALRQSRPTKRATVIAMLSRDQGSTLADLMDATGWLPHTTRAALTGLRQKGFQVERTRPDDAPSIYRIVADATARSA
jgi:DNA-binding MarR family transcriptional regulator